MTGLLAKIGERSVKCQIREKEEAKEKYENALASGNHAVMATKSEDKSLQVLVGNLMPSQEAQIELELVFAAARVSGSAYEIVIPTYCLPSYSNHKTVEGNACQPYTFEYSF